MKSFLRLNTLFFICLCLPLFVQAQMYTDPESYHIRVDPEWVKISRAYNFCWAYDVKADPQGNVYSVGYFTRSLTTDSGTIAPECPRHIDCGDTYFIMKHDGDGKLLWVRHAIRSIRPTRIAFDKKGNVMVLGNAYSPDLSFASSGGKMVDEVLSNKASSGIFICTYNPQGEVIKTWSYTQGKRESANDFYIDDRGQIYIAGSYQFRYADRRSEVKNSYLLLKLGSDFKLKWKMTGDTLGTSIAHGIYVDQQSGIYVTGGFHKSVMFGETRLKYDGYDSVPFLARLTGSGKTEWAIDSLGNFKSGAGVALVADKSGNVYVGVNTSYSVLLFTKVNAYGKLIWSHRMQGRTSNFVTRMLIDNKEQIYLSGEGYGVKFQSTDFESMAYASESGGYQFYLASYNTAGKLLWLKAGGAGGTNYCKSISLSGDHLYALGWFGSTLTFNKTVVQGNGGTVFWLGKFSLDKLAKIEIAPPPPPKPPTLRD